ncbi:uncharacterized protein PGTG_03165 [Puccinia graminis f. sp. tritici CRL 75-36-700-3]|uniref:Small RNA 2'-O-methyltransferase n=1 Tax=Puccinia graminis f. sp. tritici (strain CRL 75-36-700-3 / race SCCL) TaxID=418459 RepID=E3JYT4_PUCGT|nr:uncharacterized protein PGTG_03165 [Puccinia graminis f. sp. tritici CRL 75-36-700-3]EFP77209.1 hypothetical protein PGTG_03165 [Puccinia graminis f. sp. tritici CRL 75-36-700-3]
MANITSPDYQPKDTFQSPFYFFPSLVTQRRAFCLGFLKRQRIRTVLELGCGEGTLLGLLTNAASSLGEFPSSSDVECLKAEQTKVKDPARKERLAKIEEIVKKTPELDYYQRDLHLELLIGLDLDTESLRRVQETIKLTNQKPKPGLLQPNPRWEPLRVELWSGDLAVNNERFKDLECVVMSEVIEHLFPDQLNQSIPLLFGIYKPKWIVITTPNHEFNQYIDQYSSPETRSLHRFLDPTGRTDRYFRDSDHKFEWTQREFKVWCKAVASAYGYDFELGGCGSYVNYFIQSISSIDPAQNPVPESQLPVPESPEGFFATQCVIFKKREKLMDDEEDKDKARMAGLNHPKARKGEHQLVAVEEYLAHESVYQVSPKNEILEHVKQYLVANEIFRVRLRELWLCDQGLDRLCAGQLIQLVLAFADEDGWELSNDAEPTDPLPPLTGMDAIWISWLHFPMSPTKSQID